MQYQKKTIGREIIVRRFIYIIIFICIQIAFCSCEYKLKAFEFLYSEPQKIEICRYDRLESQYLTTSDFSAFQQMNTDYPMETRTLIEDMLKLGEVNDPEINKIFLTFYQDSTLQTLISDAESQYANVDDLNDQFNKAFANLQKIYPKILIPRIYMQIGALDQSIIIGNSTIGISIDKYLGEDYPLYRKYYPETQRKTMNRKNIVPDAICFYLMSIHQMPNFDKRPQIERDIHLGKIMWLCNKVLEGKAFDTKFVKATEKYMRCHPKTDIATFIQNNDFSAIIKHM